MDNRQITCKDTGEVVVGYENYLKTKHWSILRSLTIDKNSRCTACGSRKKLNIHHLHYRNIGRESKSDIVIVCRGCHGRIHEKHKSESNKSLLVVTKKYVENKKRKISKERKEMNRAIGQILSDKSRKHRHLLRMPINYWDNDRCLL